MKLYILKTFGVDAEGDIEELKALVNFQKEKSARNFYNGRQSSTRKWHQLGKPG